MVWEEGGGEGGGEGGRGGNQVTDLHTLLANYIPSLKKHRWVWSVWVGGVNVGGWCLCAQCGCVWLMWVDVTSVGECGWCGWVWLMWVDVTSVGECGWCECVVGVSVCGKWNLQYPLYVRISNPNN